MIENFALKEMLLYGGTLAFTFMYIVMKRTGFMVMTQYIAYVLVILGVCLLLNVKLNRVIKKRDTQAYMGVTHLKNRMEILDAVVALDVLLDGVIEVPALITDMGRDPLSIFRSVFVWYFIFCVALEVISIRLIGKYFKARKVIGQLENPLRAQNADPFAFLNDNTDFGSEEELIPVTEEQEWKKCPVCGSENPSQLRQCLFCGGEFEGRARNDAQD